MADGRAEIERVVAAYRARVAALEADYHAAVGSSRRAAQQRIRDELARLLTALERDGIPERVTRRWLTDHSAYRSFIAAAEAQLDAVTTEAARAIRWRIAEAAELGKPAADSLTAATIGTEGPRLAASGAFGQVNVGAVQQLVGALQSSSPLMRLPGLNAEALQTMQRELVRGLANGEHSRTIGTRIAKAADMPSWRAATIARTEIHRSYREANRMAYQANPMVEQWRWMSALGARTCSACWAMHGTLHNLGDPMGSHPNCRCTQAPVVDNSKLREMGIDAPDIEWPTGEELFAKQPASVQRQVLGHEKYEAFRAGKIGLNDTVQVRKSGTWGTTRTTNSTRDAIANGKPGRASPDAGRGARTGMRTELLVSRTPAKAYFDEGVDIIRTVHDPNVLLRFNGGAPSRDALGDFAFSKRDPVGKIRVRNMPGGEFTAVHEIGHAIDWQMFAPLSLTSRDVAKGVVGEMTPWHDAVKSSGAIDRISATYGFDPGYRDYLLDPAELWARSYTQWIAVRSGNDKMLRRLAELADTHWTADEFAPIAREFDRLFGLER